MPFIHRVWLCLIKVPHEYDILMKHDEHVSLFQSIKTLQKQVEGLGRVLNMKPSQATLEIHEAVFGPCGPLEAASLSLSKASSIRQPIKRDVEEETAMNGFVLPTKKSHWVTCKLASVISVFKGHDGLSLCSIVPTLFYRLHNVFSFWHILLLYYFEDGI